MMTFYKASELAQIIAIVSANSDAMVRKLDETLIRLGALADAQAVHTAKLSALIAQGVKIMATLDDDVAAVEAQTTVVAGLATFVQGLQAQIAALPSLSAAQQKQIDEIFSNVTANNAALAAAMVANTPAEPPAP